MDELVAFVRRCLDEDERVAREASPDCTPDDPRASDADIRHVARWNPARVLAEVEAKRHILDRCTRYFQWPDMSRMVTDDLAAATVLLLAQPYAGREGWREEWRSVAA